MEAPAFFAGVHGHAALPVGSPAPAPDRHIIAAWDFSEGIRSTEARDGGPLHWHGRLVNLPTRGMKGAQWSGRHLSWAAAPAAYGSIHLYDHPERGHSLYDRHADGSGICYSSRLRTNINCAPRDHAWLGGDGSSLYQYNADTHLFGWLAHHGIDDAVVTDADLHRDGYALVQDDRVILTGSHPEYHSAAMWDAMKTWLDRGGQLIYMGGNGLYWRIAFHL